MLRPILALFCFGRIAAAQSGTPADDQASAAAAPPAVSAKPADRAPAIPETYLRVRTAFAAFLKPGRDIEEAKKAALDVLLTFDGTHAVSEFTADIERQLEFYPDSEPLNLAMAVLTHHDRPRFIEVAGELRRGMVPPVWLRLTRRGDYVVTACSTDGNRWQSLSGQSIPLGEHPLAALLVLDPPLPYNKVLTDHVTATVDRISLPFGPLPSGSAWLLPSPWAETTLPPRPRDEMTVEREVTSTPQPSSAGPDGALVLRADGGILTRSGDAGRFVHCALGDAQSFTVQIKSFDANSDAFTGIMLRASMEAEAPFAAVVLHGDGLLCSPLRAGREPSLKYWGKLAALRSGDKPIQLVLARELSDCGYHDEAIAVCDRLIAADPAWMFGSHSEELQRIFGKWDAPRLGERLVAWKPAIPPPGDDRHRLASLLADSALRCADQKRYDLVAPLCQRSLELYDPSRSLDWHGAGRHLHDLLFRSLVALNRREDAADELLSRHVPLHPPADEKTAGEYDYGGWLSYGYSSDGISMSVMSEIDAARSARLLPNLEAALRRRLTLPDAPAFRQGGAEWLLALVRLARRDPAVLGDLPDLFAGKSGAVPGLTTFSNLGPALLRMMAARQLQQWPGHERLALAAFHSAPEFLDAIRRGGGDQMDPVAGLQRARAEVQLGDPSAAGATLGAVADWLAATGSSLGPAVSEGGMGGDADYTRRCLALLLHLDTPEADAIFLRVLDRVRQSPSAHEFGLLYEQEKRRLLQPAPAVQPPDKNPANLLANPDFDGLYERDPDAPSFTLSGWKDLPQGFWLLGTLGSPHPGKPFIQCEIFSLEDRSGVRAGKSVPYGEHLIRATRIPFEKGHAYLQGAWLRDAGDGGYVHFGRRFLDENGQVLATTVCPEPPSLSWRHASQHLVSRESPDKTAETVPAGTAFIEPFLQWKGAVDWTGLFIGRLD